MRGPRRTTWRIVSLVGLVIIAAVVAVLVMNRDRPEENRAAGTPPPVTTTSATPSPTPSATCSAVTGGDRLAKAREALANDPASFRLAVVGDSTRNGTRGSAGELYRTLHELLPDVPTENIVDLGRNGETARGYADNDMSLQQIAVADPDVVEVSIGINDWRVDQGIGDEFTDWLRDFVEKVRAVAPHAAVILSVPNSLATEDIGDRHIVIGADGKANPPGAAEKITTALRSAYLSLADEWPNVAISDNQTAIFGTEAAPPGGATLMLDQVHPNSEGNRRIAEQLAGILQGKC
jgi:lysophospholipase L1-like esterase